MRVPSFANSFGLLVRTGKKFLAPDSHVKSSGWQGDLLSSRNPRRTSIPFLNPRKRRGSAFLFKPLAEGIFYAAQAPRKTSRKGFDISLRPQLGLEHCSNGPWATGAAKISQKALCVCALGVVRSLFISFRFCVEGKSTKRNTAGDIVS